MIGQVQGCGLTHLVIKERRNLSYFFITKKSSIQVILTPRVHDNHGLSIIAFE